MIDFNTVLQACTTSRILILKNLLNEPVDYRVEHTNYLFNENILSAFPSAGTHSLTHSPTHSLTYSLTHSLTQVQLMHKVWLLLSSS